MFLMLRQWCMDTEFGTKKNLSTSAPRAIADLIITIRLRFSTMVFNMQITAPTAAQRWTDS